MKGMIGEEKKGEKGNGEGGKQKAIFHFPFSISHFSFFIGKEFLRCAVSIGHLYPTERGGQVRFLKRSPLEQRTTALEQWLRLLAMENEK
jgi:hypothetical protein